MSLFIEAMKATWAGVGVLASCETDEQRKTAVDAIGESLSVATNLYIRELNELNARGKAHLATSNELKATLEGYSQHMADAVLHENRLAEIENRRKVLALGYTEDEMTDGLRNRIEKYFNKKGS